MSVDFCSTGLSPKMKRTVPDSIDIADNDAAHFPIVYAVLASLIALWLSFWGPSRISSIRFTNEWRARSDFEPPQLALPLDDFRTLVCAGSNVKLLQIDSAALESEYRDFKSKVPSAEEVARTSLLGRTRVSKGRTARLGCVSSTGGLIVTEAEVLVAIHIDTHGRANAVWETSLENQDIEFVFAWEPRNKSLMQSSNIGAYIVVSADLNATTDLIRRLSFLAFETGEVLWSLELRENGSDQGVRKLDPYPIHSNDFGIEKPPQYADTEQIFVKWSSGASLVELTKHGQPISQTTRYVEDNPDSELIRVDLDGDGIPERLTYGFGPNGCIQVISHQDVSSVLFNNCSGSLSDLDFPDDFLSRGLISSVIVKRQSAHAGAGSLFGNLTLNLPQQRGFSLVFYQPSTGVVASMIYQGKVSWLSRAAIVSEGDLRVQQRLHVLRFTESPDGSIIIEASSSGVESESHILLIGIDEVFILRASDGATVSLFRFQSPIKQDPVILHGRITFLLENGEIVNLTVKPVRDLIPPLVLIPVMLALCSFWACVMWRRLEEV